MSTLKSCQELFGTKDLYKLFDLKKNAPLAEIKKAYYKLSLKVHPDRVSEADKEAATEKFKILSKIYQVLSDDGKRALYDEQGIIDDDDMNIESKLNNWLDLWRSIFKPLSEDDIQQYESTYISSELERNDIKKAYLSGKGCINHMMNEVPFLKIEDETRLQEIVRKMIDSGEVPEYKIFTEEPKQKRMRRHKKYARESKEAEQIKQKLSTIKQTNNSEGNGSNDGGSLEQQIMQRRNARESNFDTLMNNLLQKYGDDNSEEVDFTQFDKKRKAKPKNGATAKKRDSLHSVKNGRVKK